MTPETRRRELDLTIATCRPWQAMCGVHWNHQALVAQSPAWALLGWRPAEIAEILQVDVGRVRTALMDAMDASHATEINQARGTT